MNRRGGSTELAALRTRWRRWTAIIELFANRRRGRHRVNAQAYRTIHRGLTEACRSLADTADAPKRAFYRDLEELARPWLNPGVLAKADQEILLDLLLRCREAERDLGGRTRGIALLRLAVLVLMGSSILVVFRLSDWSGPGVWSRVLGWSDSFWLALLGRSGSIERFFLSSTIVILVSLSIASRVARS
jgi:hypothetical protein